MCKLHHVLVVTLLLSRLATGEGTPQYTSTAAPTPIAERYRDQAERIISATLAGNDSWKKLQELCDDIGHRQSGSPQLEQAIDWAVATLKEDGLVNVRREPVEVTHWVRGHESLTVLEPRNVPINLLGLGGSVGTRPEGLTAELVVVRDEEELKSLGSGAAGKIVLFNNPMPKYTTEHGTGYGTAVRFRSHGARLAAEQGALACLIRSVTATSLVTPHTGAMRYGEAKVKIPAAAITLEGAEMFARWQAREKKIVLNLKMGAKLLEPAQSANVVGELRGSTLPDEIVVIGGHIDSWDVGQGAHDDGGPCVVTMEVLNVLRRLNMIPKRTIRVVLWTNEEHGLDGAKAYAADHEAELANHVAAIEMDMGVFEPRGFSLECSNKERAALAAEQLRDITSLFSRFGANQVRLGGSGADLIPLRSSDIVLMGHSVEVSRYFNFHHSAGDTIDKIDPEHLSQNVAVLAATAYIIADLPHKLGEQPQQ